MDAASVAKKQEAGGLAGQAQRDFPGLALSAGGRRDRTDQSDPAWLGRLFRGRPLQPMFLIDPRLGREEDSAPLGQGVSASRFRLEAVEQGMAVPNLGTLFGVPRFVWITLGSRPSMIGLISFAMNCAGARSAGNPHATCDVAGAGNGATANPIRARRGKPRTQAKDGPKGPP